MNVHWHISIIGSDTFTGCLLQTMLSNLQSAIKMHSPDFYFKSLVQYFFKSLVITIMAVVRLSPLSPDPRNADSKYDSKT